MQPNVLTAFLGNRQDKVKVFPTTKKVKPFHLSSKMLRRTFPFLMASAMVFTACSDGKEQKSENSSEQKGTTEVKAITPSAVSNTFADVKEVAWEKIYHQVVDQYRLASLADKIPLSVKEINQLMNTPQDVVPNDSNFNHLPENQENFWEMVKGGITVVQDIQKDPTISDAHKQKCFDKCIEALSKISKRPWSDNEVDLDSYNNLHAFLFFEKMVKYKSNFEMSLYEKKGWIDEQQEYFGRYYQDHLEFAKKAKGYPGIEMFAKALYTNNDRFIIEAKDSVYANVLSRKMYEQWRCEQGIKDEHLGSFDVDKYDKVNGVRPASDRGASFGLNLAVDPSGKMDFGYYLPVGLLEIHEGQHVAAMWPKSREMPEDNCISSEDETPQHLQKLNANYVELGPTLYTLTLSDRIYKAIHKIDRGEEVDYGVNIEVSNNSIPLGKIANWFGDMLEKYPSKSIDKVLQEKEVLEQLNTWGMNAHELPLMKMNNLDVSR